MVLWNDVPRWQSSPRCAAANSATPEKPVSGFGFWRLGNEISSLGLGEYV